MTDVHNNTLFFHQDDSEESRTVRFSALSASPVSLCSLTEEVQRMSLNNTGFLEITTPLRVMAGRVRCRPTRQSAAALSDGPSAVNATLINVYLGCPCRLDWAG